METIERTKITIDRIVSPAEFYIHLSSVSKKCQNDDYLGRISDLATFKCHLAFIAPTDNIKWTLTAIDKFKEYIDRFGEFAVTLPRSIAPSSQSTGVILWTLYQKPEYILDALEAEQYSWLNINLRMVFQGLAQPIVHIEHFQRNFSLPFHIPEEIIKQQKHHSTEKRRRDWLPARMCRSKELTGIPVHIDANLTIYLQDSDNQECVKIISSILSQWHRNRQKRSSKCWNIDEICTVKCNDICYYRGKIIEIRKGKCLVHLVDFGRNELVSFKHLSTYIKFQDVPIQVKKCRLFNTIVCSEDHTEQILKLCTDTILGRQCSLYIHDCFDPLHPDSIVCSLRSFDEAIDFSTHLISLGLAQYSTALIDGHEMNKSNDRKRHRTQADEPLIIDSSTLRTINDFQLLYESKRVIVPPLQTSFDNEVDRTFEVFELPTKRCPLDPMDSISDEVANNTSYPIVDRITKHFTMLRLNNPTIYCRVLFVVDPVCILIMPHDSVPLAVDTVELQPKYCPLEEYSPCIAFLDHKWRRGIVWEKISTNKYKILFVDTMRILEVQRKLIQKCPSHLLGSTLPFAKVHLSKIKPNDRLRTRDICDALSNTIMNIDLYAKFVRVHDDGSPDIKLYSSADSKSTVYHQLVRNRYYKKMK